MNKIFKTISASLVTALIVFAAILTTVVFLEMFVVKLFPNVSFPIYRACCVDGYYQVRRFSPVSFP